MGSAGICAMAPAQWGGSVLTNPELARFAPNIGVTVVPSIDEAGEMRVLPMGGFGMGMHAVRLELLLAARPVGHGQ